MVNLDDPAIIHKTANGQTVLESIDHFTDQCRQAWIEASQISFPQEYKQLKHILVCGMGGSRFTPLTVKELFKEDITVPYIINDNYSLPAFVGPETLVILSSYSGTTEEVLICANEAQKRGAKISGLCLGGALAELFKANNYPAYVFDAKFNPSQQPRIGVGYMIAGHIGLMSAAGYLKMRSQEMAKVLDHLPALLSTYKMEVPVTKNPAKQMALSLYDKYPYYIMAEHLQGVANAIANQTNETAKLISSYRYIPELNHHLMEGLKFPAAHIKLAVFVLFPSRFYDRRVRIRFDITKEIVEKNGIQTLVYETTGETKLEEALALIGFGSYMTMYLSALYEQDPSVIPWVDYFKQRLKELAD